MTGSFLGAWVLFPLVLLAASAGGGLLVRRLAGGELAGVLVLPVGFALVVVICSFADSYSWLAGAAGPIVAGVCVIGLALELRAGGRPRRPARPGAWVWAALAALVGFGVVGGPVFLTGSVGWTGYTRIVDTAFQMDFAEYIAHAGRVSPPNGNSSYTIVAAKLMSIGYPGGAQATLGSIARLSRVNLAWAYQAYLAFTAAMGSLAIFCILGRVTPNNLMRFLGASIAIEPNVLYAYAQEAGIKELTTAVLLLAVVALFAEQLPGRGGRRAVIAHAVAISGAFGAFSLGIAPWLGLLLVGTFIASLTQRLRRRRTIESWLVLSVVAVLITIPGIVTASKLAGVAGSAVGGVVDLGLGNLAAPVSRWAAAGVWITGDYRYTLIHPDTSHVFDLIIIALALIGVVLALLRRRWVLVVFGVMTPIALEYFIEHSTAWIQFKAFSVTSAFVVTLGFLGAASLQVSRRRWLSGLGWLAALAMGAGILWGNALIYHDQTIAPGARYHDLAAIASRFANNQGRTLDPTFDEYAEYFLRSEKGSTLVDPANLEFDVVKGAPVPAGGQAFAWDLNQLVPEFIQRFHLIIQPRSPIASRAPSNFDLVDQTRYFDVWRHDRPSATVLRHFPLSSLPHERTRALCRRITALARSAGPGAQVTYARAAPVAVANPVEGIRPDYWKALGPSTIAAYGAGSDLIRFKVASSGRFEVWLQGSIGRPIAFYVDGRRLASLGYEERYPNQFLLVGHTSLSAGRHTLRLVRGGGSLHPASGDAAVETDSRTVGAIVFARQDSPTPRIYVAPASRMAQICAAPVGYQWIELIRPGGAPANALPAPG